MADEFINHPDDGFEHIDKDPGAKLNYTGDWRIWMARAGNPTITGVEVAVLDPGITLVGSASFNGAYTTQMIDAGEIPGAYRAKFKVTFSDGQIDYRTIVIHVRNR